MSALRSLGNKAKYEAGFKSMQAKELIEKNPKAAKAVGVAAALSGGALLASKVKKFKNKDK